MHTGTFVFRHIPLIPCARVTGFFLSDSVDLYLPQGTWMHVWSGANITVDAGGRNMTAVAAPVGTPAVYMALHEGGSVEPTLLPFLAEVRAHSDSELSTMQHSMVESVEQTQ